MTEKELNEIVKIEQLPVVFEQLALIGEYIDERVKDLDQLECTEDNKQEVKKRRSQVNNTLNILEAKRKEVKTKINEPYDIFNKKYEETTKIKLKNALTILDTKISSIETEQKNKKRIEVERYFKEYRDFNNIDFINFDDLMLDINLSVSEKKYKERVKEFIDKIVNDLNLIETQEYKDEILIEYKKVLDVSIAITTVVNRHKELEKMKQIEIQKQEEKKLDQENIAKVDEVLKAPIRVTEKSEDDKEEILEMTFKVRDTRTRLKALKDWLNLGGYSYE